MIILSNDIINFIYNKNVDWFTKKLNSYQLIHKKYDYTIYNIHNFLDLEYLYSLGNHIYIIENEKLNCYEMIF